MRAARVPSAALAALLLLAPCVVAQEVSPGASSGATPPAAEPGAEQGGEPRARAKPKPRPKPVRKPARESTGEPAKEAPGLRGAPESAAPELRPGGRGEAAPFAVERSETPPAAPPRASGAVVACEPGQAVLYDGPGGFSFWVTRSGAVTIDNPLRPLTPDVTRVLQLVIGDKLATAYGRDLDSLRRGASPAALEGMLGGPIRWDPALATLPDGLDIVADSGQPLAQMRFKECGTAPAAKALPVAGKAGRTRGKEGQAEGKPKGVRRGPATEQAGAPAGAEAPPRRLNLPQGALPE